MGKKRCLENPQVGQPAPWDTRLLPLASSFWAIPRVARTALKQSRAGEQAVKHPGRQQVQPCQGVGTLRRLSNPGYSSFSRAQTSHLSKQILQGAGVKERGCIWNFFFLIAIFLLLWRMSPYRLLIIIGPMPVGEIEPRRQEDKCQFGEDDLRMHWRGVLVVPRVLNAGS